MEHWNTHRILHSRHGTTAGVPDILYYLPERSHRMDCKVELSDEKINEVEAYCHDIPLLPSEINEYEEYYM